MGPMALDLTKVMTVTSDNGWTPNLFFIWMVFHSGNFLALVQVGAFRVRIRGLRLVL